MKPFWFLLSFLLLTVPWFLLLCATLLQRSTPDAYNYFSPGVNADKICILSNAEHTFRCFFLTYPFTSPDVFIHTVRINIIQGEYYQTPPGGF